MLVADYEDEFERTGERLLLERLAPYNIKTIIDVGANRGMWSLMASRHIPTANIHAFEIIPDTFYEMMKNTRHVPNIVPNGLGMSDSIGIIKVKQCTSNDTFSTTLELMAPGTVGSSVFHWINALTVTGDAYCDSRGLDHIDLLKIDTEGAEGLVFAGFANTLDNIDVIQFEYGTANIIARWLLMDAYALLTPKGFAVGLLTPNGVNFSPYNLTMEDFRGPNYIAVHERRPDIIAALKI